MGFEEELIEEIREKVMLYDKRHPMYRNQQKKDRMWKELSIELKVDEMKCRNRWKCIRDQYMRELRKQKGPSGSGALDRKQWKYFEMLHFLRDSIVPREHPSNYDQQFEDDDDMSAELPPQNSFIPISEESMENSSFLREFTQLGEPESSRSAEPVASTPIADSRSQKTRDSDSREDFQKFLHGMAEKFNEKEKEEDSMDIFFKSLAKSIKSLQLSPFQIMDLQCKIMNVVKHEMSKYINNIKKS